MHALLLLACIALAPALVTAQCSTTCTRREFRTLSQDERTRYFRAVSTLMSNGQYDQFTAWHLQYANQAHNAPLFLPWHRAMMRQFEVALQAVDAGVCLHYWAWDVDSQAPENAAVWAADAYGSSSSCVQFSWMPSGWQPSNPNRHCLSRSWTGGSSIGAFSSPEVVNSLIVSARSYESFRDPFESGPHAQPHNQVGGDMATMSSPNDPIFYAHHVNVDRLYWQWQQAHPDVANTYPGSTDTVLAPFPQSISQVFNIGNLCYSYAPLTATAVALAASESESSMSSTRDDFVSLRPLLVDPSDITSSLHQRLRNLTTVHRESRYNDGANRRNLRGLRYPSPLSSHYIRNMGYNITTVRAYEAQCRAEIDQLNSIVGYTSPVALYRRRDLLRGLLDSDATKETFYVDIPGTNDSVEISFNATGNATDMNRKVREIYKKVQTTVPELIIGGPSVKEQVVKIAGAWTGDKSEVANFEAAAAGDRGATPESDKPEASDANDVRGSSVGFTMVVLASVVLVGISSL